ncbi:hypothetical protein MYX84_16575 [Acidobacteria bacterium AH-259-O06]|nr:hypothetical protein [Acidobacteria bacterium AH-259-O06]
MKQHPKRKNIAKQQRLQEGHKVALLCDHNLIGEVVGHTKGGAVIVKWQGRRRRYVHNPRFLRRLLEGKNHD